MTFAQFYLLRLSLDAIADLNAYRLANMTDAGKVAFYEAVGRHAVAAYERGLRGDSLVIHVNMMLGG